MRPSVKSVQSAAKFSLSLAKYARMPQGVPSGLRIYAQPVGSLANGNLRDQMTVIRVDGIDLGVVPAGKPEHFAISRDAAHIGAAAAWELPFLRDFLRLEINQRNASFISIRYVQHL